MAPHGLTESAPASASAPSSGVGSAPRGSCVKVVSDTCSYEPDHILSSYTYENARVETTDDGEFVVHPTKSAFTFKTSTEVPKTGLMIVGWGGNNGSTLTATIAANKNNVTWSTRRGLQKSNYYGSVTQSSTVKLGIDAKGRDVYAPFGRVLPMVHPNDLVLGGWDINDANIGDAMERSKVLDYDLQQKVKEELKAYKPLPSIYYPDFIAANQGERANNLKQGMDKWQHVLEIQKDIREFKEKNGLDKVFVMWSANTERYAEIIPGVNDTADNLLKSIKESHSEVAPSTVFAVACILMGVVFINGAPQNTFVPGALELAEREKVFIGGDDFKSGQTKIKSVLAQFLVDAGIKPLSIVSYNHLGNNDGYNLSAPQQFRSKEISKSSVVDDVIASNQILFNKEVGDKVDHCIVIKYVPAVGDNKVAMDEYHSELMMGGRNNIAIHTVCEDSILAAPLIIDLVVVAELFGRVQFKREGSDEWEGFHSVLSVLSYWLKAPIHRRGEEPINGLNKQRMALENLFRAFLGMGPNNEMRLESRDGRMKCGFGYGFAF
ncbi:Myo-inositol-1-phosphate synthase [Saitoella complicata NRRL Y-17804]|uniref:Myo-inositol-1-phosphate synthase n=1 Tax=Saitoella complicata (strain BCRC 22490 / CBS 7301 / JCM 7358 / NBRC 10748 / NRRL Y-17804) TaxID=698492 RepID=UPI0008681713|nr:Myo-inositol-1-phosphate synthase [Saitoella complicata NRRL Y-17804]ODQ52726.1 Myo-inositol-1-phosphate synthase [Saitoella complicata NRRL Y-17804]